MKTITRSLIDNGMNGTIVDVECHLSNNLPTIVIVGAANKSVDEARERLRGAFAGSKLDMPRKRITINLAPADLPKDGSSFDLAIAASILVANGQLDTGALEGTLIFGELGLNGSVRPIRGIIGKLLAAQRLGITRFIVPYANLGQARLVSGIQIAAIEALGDLYIALQTGTLAFEESGADAEIPVPRHTSDFSDIIGQPAAKRALEIAAAGQHNVLLSGAPGTGKSMLARALPTILPPMLRSEMLTVTHLHSLSGQGFDKIVAQRPFRAPHHSSSALAIIGGGAKPRPGEISLAHSGVLFLDELPEFDRRTIETLRQPLEDKYISISRARDTVAYPADFILVSTKNPCPCGYYGTGKPCTCSPQTVALYEKKLSGPILDRIDLYVDVDSVNHVELLEMRTKEERSEQITKRVAAARARQYDRPENNGQLNGSLNNGAIKQTACLTTASKALLDTAAAALGLSARAYMRAVKVARTIADLESSSHVTEAHIAEALQYRPRPLGSYEAVKHEPARM